jgi:hypothetical protein
MDCPVCNNQMEERNGKFGVFHYCRPHGTVSVQGRKVVASGAIKQYLDSIMARRSQRHALADIDWTEMPIIDVAVQRQMAAYGMIMTDMDRFCEGGAEAAMDEPDHWMNMRPY